ncbi:MAG: glycosyltransferase [Candidatus Fusobacterium pullicola]|uniref:Glycosyltransferase n=1 Tax=Candidatus Fusobacterium pullicola TaxID=2838601 RepID=A0A9E2KXU3_9FUSO|nr:glycosyltransferase [Candidatus Fusobacterium pullicola]
MEKPIRVLQIGDWEFGKNGIATIAYNLFRNMNDENIIFDFLIQNEIEDDIYKKGIENKQGKIYELKIKTKGIRKKVDIFIKMINFFRKNKFEIVHIHESTAHMMLFYGIITKICGVKTIILHSHSSGFDSNYRMLKSMLHNFAKQCIPLITKNYIACSQIAAKWVYKEKYLPIVKIIHNGIEMDKFKFNMKIRNKVRKKFQIENNFIIGHVGRFSYQKNHEFLLELFIKIKKEKIESKLLLVGDGLLRSKIENKAKKNGILEDIIFVNKTNSIEQYYQAMDIFLLPSNFEGLAIVGIEAQVAGLSCLFSNNIPKEIEITELCQFLELDTAIWEHEVVNNHINLHKRKNYKIKKEYFQYKIENSARNLESYYMNLGEIK